MERVVFSEMLWTFGFASPSLSCSPWVSDWNFPAVWKSWSIVAAQPGVSQSIPLTSHATQTQTLIHKHLHTQTHTLLPHLNGLLWQYRGNLSGLSVVYFWDFSPKEAIFGRKPEEDWVNCLLLFIWIKTNYSAWFDFMHLDPSPDTSPWFFFFLPQTWEKKQTNILIWLSRTTPIFSNDLHKIF